MHGKGQEGTSSAFPISILFLSIVHEANVELTYPSKTPTPWSERWKANSRPLFRAFHFKLRTCRADTPLPCPMGFSRSETGSMMMPIAFLGIPSGSLEAIRFSSPFLGSYPLAMCVPTLVVCALAVYFMRRWHQGISLPDLGESRTSALV